VTKSAAVDLFQAALRSNGAAIVNSNGSYKIVPVDQAPVGAIIATSGAPDPGGGKIGSGLQVVQLKYVAASEMRRILEPIAPRGAIVRADDSRHTLTLSGNNAEIAGLMEAISVFDVDVMRGMSFALVPVKMSDPGAIADELKTVFSSEREGPMADMVQFLPNKRLGAILVISPQRNYLDRAAEWVHRLDAQAAGKEKQFFTYSVQNRRAQELVDVLQSMFPSDTGGGQAGGTRNVAPQYREANLQSGGTQSSFGGFGSGSGTAGSVPQAGGTQGGFGQSGFGQGSATQGITGSTPPRSQAAAGGRGSGSAIQMGRDEATGEARIKVAADEAKNAILIEASPNDYRRMMRVIGSLDVMPNQVLLEATIAEVTLTDELKFGVRWHLQSSDQKANSTFTDDASGAVASVFPGFSYALTTANIGVTLNALNQITDVNVISSPSLTVMDNRTAILQVGDQVPITTSSAVNVIGTGTGVPIVNSISYRDTGVILAMTPRINQSGRVLLDIEQEVSTVAPTTSSNIDSPTFRQRRVKTSVAVNNNETLVLGGLIQDNKTVSRTQVPVLGDIPIIGNAFKTKDNSINKTELIIVITPHVMRGVSEARQVTDEFRRELSISVPPSVRQFRNLGKTMGRVLD
jgi:general secretion pathway protein D